jgi:hypothetical protein
MAQAKTASFEELPLPLVTPPPISSRVGGYQTSRVKPDKLSE